MNDTTADQHTLINRQLRRLRRLTIASLSVNGLVLFLILLGAILHHHHMKHRHHDGDGDRHGDFSRDEGRGDFHQHRPGGRGDWNHSGGSDRMGGGEQGRDFGQPDLKPDGGGDFGGDRQGGPGENGGAGFGQHHHSMGGMMNAGNPPDPAKMTDGILNHLTQQLTLTDDQKAKIKPIISEGVSQFQKDAEDRRQAMQKQIEDTKAKIKSLLNADQQKQLDAMHMPGERPPADAGKPDASANPNP